MDSIFAQTHTDFEFIVLDDCSTDNSMNLITEYYSKLDRDKQGKMRILRNDKNIGLPASCNKILDNVRGKFTARLDSDDVLLPTAIEKMLETVKIEGTQGVLSGYYETKEKLTQTAEILENMWHPGGALMSTWILNELRYREDLKYMEGQEFFKRFNKQYKVSFIKEALWCYRKRPGQKTQEKEHPNNGVE